MADERRIIVVPYVGTWIEIGDCDVESGDMMVVPYVGTWIEILKITQQGRCRCVVPYVGTWIEITSSGSRRNEN